MTPFANLLLSLFTIGFIYLGFYYIVKSVNGYFKNRKAYSWPSTAGEITMATCEKHDGENGAIYTLSLTYKYNVNGQEYEGKRYSYSNNYSIAKKKKYDEIINEFRQNPKVNVYYNPKKSFDSVLNFTPRGFSMLFGCIFGLANVGFAAYLFWKILANNTVF